VFSKEKHTTSAQKEWNSVLRYEFHRPASVQAESGDGI